MGGHLGSLLLSGISLLFYKEVSIWLHISAVLNQPTFILCYVSIAGWAQSWFSMFAEQDECREKTGPIRDDACLGRLLATGGLRYRLQ